MKHLNHSCGFGLLPAPDQSEEKLIFLWVKAARGNVNTDVLSHGKITVITALSPVCHCLLLIIIISVGGSVGVVGL